jgi:hypothetical protein
MMGCKNIFIKIKERFFETPYKFPLKYGIIRERRVPLKIKKYGIIRELVPLVNANPRVARFV